MKKLLSIQCAVLVAIFASQPLWADEPEKLTSSDLSAFKAAYTLQHANELQPRRPALTQYLLDQQASERLAKAADGKLDVKEGIKGPAGHRLNQKLSQKERFLLKLAVLRGILKP